MPNTPIDLSKEYSQRYHRPNEKWLCGQAEHGCECRRGPSTQGECGAQWQCTPVQQGNRWFCKRPPELGGNCEDGPKPNGECCQAEQRCVPQRSLAAKRKLLSFWVFGVSVAICLIFSASFLREQLILPGPLSKAHEMLADCNDCHRNSADASIETLIKVALSEQTEQTLNDHNNACTDCHTRTGHPNQPHDGINLKTISSNPFPMQGEPIACASCHAEHRGQSLIPKLSSSNCNSCHQKRINHFEKDHPPFENYPYLQSTAIHFDHGRHFDRHFPETPENAPTSCTGCHQLTDNGQRMKLSGFESCAGCHSEDVNSNRLILGTRGIAVLELPGWDLPHLAATKTAIGVWPEWAEAPINPFWTAIFADNTQALEAISHLQGIDTLDLSHADSETLQAISQLSWAIKIYLNRIEKEGVTDSSNNDPSLLTSLPRSALQQAIQQWFPELEQELNQFNAGNAPLSMVPQITQAAEEQPTEASADLAIGGLLDAEPSEESLDQLFNQPLDETIDDETLGDLFSSDSSGLEEESLGDLFTTTDDQESGELAALFPSDASEEDTESLGDLFSSTPDEQELGNLFSTEGHPDESPPSHNQSMPTESIDPETWASTSGWYFKEFALYYRPTGHADPAIQSWWQQARQSDTHGSVFASVYSESKIPGQCSKCHIGLSPLDGTPFSTWKRTLLKPAAPLTQFTHRSHFDAKPDAGCSGCHQLSSDKSEQNLQPLKSDFEGMTIQQCSSCHTEEKHGSDDCQTCHLYHPEQTLKISLTSIIKGEESVGNE